MADLCTQQRSRSKAEYVCQKLSAQVWVTPFWLKGRILDRICTKKTPISPWNWKNYYNDIHKLTHGALVHVVLYVYMYRVKSVWHQWDRYNALRLQKMVSSIQYKYTTETTVSPLSEHKIYAEKCTVPLIWTTMHCLHREACYTWNEGLLFFGHSFGHLNGSVFCSVCRWQALWTSHTIMQGSAMCTYTDQSTWNGLCQRITVSLQEHNVALYMHFT